MPRTIRIGEDVWKVKQDYPLVHPKYGLSDGLCDFDAKTIWLSRRLSMKAKQETLLHELLHAVWPEGIVSHRVEEKIVHGIDEKLLKVILENKLGAVFTEAVPEGRRIESGPKKSRRRRAP